MVGLSAAPEVIEQTIGSLRGVQGVKVVQTPHGEIEELHVLVDAERSPKQAVRDVESILLTKLGVQIDHRKISVAQLNMATPSKRSPAGRLKFVEATVGMKRNRMQACVGLERDGQVYTHTAEGVYSGAKQLRLIAEATLGAVQQAGIMDVSLSVEEVTRLDLGGKDVVVTVVKEVSDGSETSYSGSAVCKQDVFRAAVNATLAAMNRRITRAA
ncbi:MAG TPA: hypothetical protein VGN26_16750 [Armatimonadota bacterium]|jgi:hypothetical protein